MQSAGSAPLSGSVTLPDGTTADASEIITIDASKIPIPGLVVLDVDGTVIGNYSFLEGGDRVEMIDFLEANTK